MRITIRHHRHYDWVPVPAGTPVTDADYASGKVKKSGNGAPIMRITRDMDNHTEVHVPENMVIAKIIDEKTRPSGGRTLSRKEAVAMFLGEHVIPNHTHRSWVTGVEVHDDGPDEKLARSMLEPHTKAPTDELGGEPNIDPSELDSHLAAYLESATADDHAAHISAHLSRRGAKKPQKGAEK